MPRQHTHESLSLRRPESGLEGDKFRTPEDRGRVEGVADVKVVK
jgi:hypothetical protein